MYVREGFQHLEVEIALQLSNLIIKLSMIKLYLPLEQVIFLLPHISQVMQGVFQVTSKPLCTFKGILMSQKLKPLRQSFEGARTIVSQSCKDALECGQHCTLQGDEAKYSKAEEGCCQGYQAVPCSH